jgi:transcriptional regulator with PAS, ATPase and Fis domain
MFHCYRPNEYVQKHGKVQILRFKKARISTKTAKNNKKTRKNNGMPFVKGSTGSESLCIQRKKGGFMLLRNLSNPHCEPIEMSEFLCFGSDQENHIVLSDDEMAAKHARIEKKGEYYLVRDLRSSNGTYVNGVKVLESYLTPGDVIKMGKTEFIFHSPDDLSEAEHLSSKNATWAEQLQKIPNIAQSDLPVLILGPSGSGKEVLSTYIHRLSSRKDAVLLTVNCSALTESLAESELFGHVRGSYTGATQDRKGAFEAAKNGTLILDEIGDLPLSLQPKLLRALENKEIKPVGSDKIVKTNVRIIACTHQNLKKKVETGEFRLDLFYRLNIIQVNLPPLKNRIEDFEKILFTFSKEMKVKFTHCAIQELMAYDWPGNIRELKNVVSRARATMRGQPVEKCHVLQLLEYKAVEIQSFGTIQIPNGNSPSKTNIIKEIEKQIIQKRLLMNAGNQRKTADDLGIPRSTLNDRIRTYKININDLIKGKWENSDH